MSGSPFASGSALRLRLMLRSASLQGCVAILLLCYFLALLQLTAEQWRELLIAAVLSAGLAILAQIAIQLRFDRAVVACVDAQAGGAARPDQLRSGFEAVMDLPRRISASVLASWLVAAMALPGWMLLRLTDLSGSQPSLIAALVAMGGLLAGVFAFFVLKRFVAPLRDGWARQLGNPSERRNSIRRLSLFRKLGVAVAGVMVSGVLAAALFSYGLAFRPIEGYCTRVQSGYVGRMAQRIVGPRDPLLGLARDDLEELGIAGQLLVVDLGSGRVVGGPAEALSASELRWIASDRGAAGTSLEFDSGNSFAWARIEDDETLALVAVTPRELLEGDLGSVRLAFGGLLLVALGIALAAAFLMADDVSRATEWLRLEAGRIAAGDLTRGEVRESEDELGDLARSFEEMTDSLRATVGRVAEAAERVDAEASAIARAGTSVAAATGDQVEGIKRASGSMAAINAQVSGIARSAQVLNGYVEEASSSILELGAAGEELNQTASSLNDQVGQVSGSIEEMIQSARQVADNTEGLAGAVSDTSASMAQMADSMRQVDRAATETARLSSQVVELADGGRERVRQTVAGMDAIREATSGADAVIRGLGSRVKEIGAIVTVIDEVADETNLLALNAAIIAAQAGDQGRAFSVVADEIKDLADRVLASTKEISALVRSVQAESDNAVDAIERGTGIVRSGVDLAAGAGAALEEITRAARASGERIGEIVQAVREQAADTSRVSDLMGQVNRSVEEIRAAGREQERGNQVVMRGAVVMRDVAHQTHRTTEEQARGAARIRDSIESVREAVERIHVALQEQSGACHQAVSFLEQVHERTRSNQESSRHMSEATQGLKQQADALRKDVRRFRIG